MTNIVIGCSASFLFLCFIFACSCEDAGWLRNLMTMKLADAGRHTFLRGGIRIVYQVLLVENEERTRVQACSYPLWRHGFYRLAGVAVNGKDALEKMAVNRFDIVIADVTMPVMGGLELCRQIRDGGYASCVILAGPQNDFYCAREGMRLGAVDYIEKPYSEEKLTEALFFAGRSRLMPEEDTGIRFYRKLLETPNQADAAAIAEELCTEAKKGCLNPEAELRGRVRDILEQIWQKMEEDALWIRFLDPVDISDRSGRFCGKRGNSGNFKASEDLSGMEPCGDAEIWRIESEGAEIRRSAQQVIEEFLERIRRYDLASPDLLVNRIAGIVEQNAAMENIQDYLEQQLDLSRDYMGKRFRRRTGVTISDYCMRMRMEKAKGMLRGTNKKVYEISGELGYATVDYFTKLFKNYTGCTPAGYRKSC